MVSRETSIDEVLTDLGVPNPGSGRRRLLRFTELLSDGAVPKGYLGPEEAARVFERHVLDSLAVAQVIGAGHLIDVGSGAGLPGIPLACVRSDRTTLVEGQTRRCQFLREVVHELELDNVTVVNARAETAGRSELRESADVVVARALGPLAVVLELTMPLACVGGRVVIMLEPAGRSRDASTDAGSVADRPGPRTDSDRGRGSPEVGRGSPARPGHDDKLPVLLPERRREEGSPEKAAPSGSEGPDDSPDDLMEDLRREDRLQVVSEVSEALGGAPPEVVESRVPGVFEPGWVMMVRKIQATPERYPRRPGVPERRPLG